MMTEAQIQRAANDTDGTSGWSPEVRYLAALVVRLKHAMDERDKALEDVVGARMAGALVTPDILSVCR